MTKLSLFMQLWAASGLESRDFSNMEELSNSMGLFLQKNNIIRDYLEDIMEEPAPRHTLPQLLILDFRIFALPTSCTWYLRMDSYLRKVPTGKNAEREKRDPV